MRSLPKKVKNPRFWGATIVLSGIVLSKFWQLKEFWRFRGGKPDTMIPKQNAGFRIYVVMGQNQRIGLPQILSEHHRSVRAPSFYQSTIVLLEHHRSVRAPWFA